MKLHLKLIAFLLALLCLASAWGCALEGIGDESAEKTSADTTVPLIDTDLATFEETKEPEAPADTEAVTLPYGTEPVPDTTDPNTPPSLNFGGETIKILFGSDADCNEFNADLSGEVIDDSVFKRNVLIQDQLGVKLEWTSKSSSASESSAFVQYATNMSNAGEPFDIFAASRCTMAKMLTSALLRDFNKIENSHIDLTSPWYPRRLADNLRIGGSIFLVTGDISANSLLQMNCIFYNVGLAEQIGARELTKRVSDGTWTLDALIELSSGMYVDQDGSGSKTDFDCYGFCSSNYLNSDAFYSGSGLKFYETPGGNGRLTYASDDLESEKAFELSRKLFGFFGDPNSYIKSPSTPTGNYQMPFVEGRALFCHSTLGFATSSSLQKSGFEYGIMPIPKYNVEQSEYITSLSDDSVFWGIYLYSAKDTISSAVIEAMAYQGYSLIAPAVFENTMKYRYSPDHSSASEPQEIYDLMRNCISVDVAKLFSEDTASLPATFANCATSGAEQWKSKVSSASFSQMTIKADLLNRSIQKAIEDQNK